MDYLFVNLLGYVVAAYVVGLVGWLDLVRTGVKGWAVTRGVTAVFGEESGRMTILQVQIFVLLLGAFLLGAATACLFRRAFSGPREDEVAAAAAAVLGGASSAARYLTFRAAPLRAIPATPCRRPSIPFKVPVVEVQPIPAAQPQPIARQPEPPPPAPVVAEPVLTPPPPVEMPILPVAAEERTCRGSRCRARAPGRT